MRKHRQKRLKPRELRQLQEIAALVEHNSTIIPRVKDCEYGRSTPNSTVSSSTSTKAGLVGRL